MSKPSRQSFTCRCGETFEADVFKSANVTLQPDLKARILGRRFNRIRCPACQAESDADVPFLYHDMAADLLVWVYPSSSAAQAEVIREKIRRSYQIIGSVLPHPVPPTGRDVVFGLDELVSLIAPTSESP